MTQAGGRPGAWREALASLWIPCARFLRREGVEGIFWMAGLLFLAFQAPSTEPHFTLCPFALAGFGHCPGCGLGRSIAFFLHGDVAHSLHMHLLGIPALFIILARCAALALRPLHDEGTSFPLHRFGESS